MVRAHWSRLAFRAFFSLVHRVRCRAAQRRELQHHARGRRYCRLRRSYFTPVTCQAAEVLEDRVLLSMALNDSYSVVHDHTLTKTAATGVVANDMNMGNGTLTAS